MHWYDRPTGRKRLDAEQQLLARDYPAFILDITNSGEVFALGHLGGTDHIRDTYEVLIRMPPNFGTGAIPRVSILNPDLRAGAPHRFTDGSLCLQHEIAFTPRSTLLTLLAWITAWLILYEGWLENGKTW